MGAKLSGAAKSRLDLGQNSDMNVTPFVDVMLVLLIIFMVVAPLATVSTNLDLPPTRPTLGPHTPPTFISIQDSGQISVSLGVSSSRPSSLDRLGADLAASLGVANPTGERVFIRADRHVRYRTFMNVINQLQLDGYYKVSLIAEDLGAPA